MSENPITPNPVIPVPAPTPTGSLPVTGPLTSSIPPLASDEKMVQVMLYTNQALWWGTVIMKEKWRVHAWLRTSAVPEIIHIYNARLKLQGTPEKHKPIAVKDAHILTSDIIAYHLLPPDKEDLDYDVNEPNRHMEAVVAFAGFFRFDGNVILSNLYNIGKYVETTHERFVSMYEVEIIYPYSSDQAPLKVPHALVKLSTAVLASK
jgi:hypothetical protein